MRLCDYPRPKADTGWGFHDSAGTSSQPQDLGAYARYLHRDLGMRWFKVLAGGTGKADLVRTFTAEGIECIVRLYADRPHPRHVVSAADVRAYVAAGAHYFEWGNEPNLRIEWDTASWDEGARVDKVAQQWLSNRDVIAGQGGIPLLPALAPGGDYPHRAFYRTLFDWLALYNRLPSLEGAALAIHNRPLNHPLDYKDDSGCMFLDYEWIDDLVREYLGHSLPLLGTEAGYEPLWDQDNRYPAIDLDKHGQYNLGILRGFTPRGSFVLTDMDAGVTLRWRDALFCQCMWLCDMWGHQHEDFARAAWHHNPLARGADLPAVQALRSEWAVHPFERVLIPYYHGPQREPGEITHIVIHDTEGPAAAALAWWQDPANPWLSSAHYLIKATGEVVPVVPVEYEAWHAGGSALANANRCSIGIELEYPAAPASPPWPLEQVAAAISLVRELAQKYGIGRENVVRHADIDPANRSDPRGFAWAAFLNAVYPHEGLPSEETATDAATLKVKVRWWTEEALRQHEAGNDARAWAILYDMVRPDGLMYRSERAS